MDSPATHFQPANVNYGLFPALAERVPKRQRRAAFAARAAADLAAWAERQGLAIESPERPPAAVAEHR